MKKLIAIVFVIIVIVGVAYIVQTISHKNIEEESPVVTTPVEYIGKPTFTWEYSEFVKNEIPGSVITLRATYENGATKKQEIDTIEGSCNALHDQDPEDKRDVYAKSEMILCYYAGYGHYYKVVESNGSYLVKRKLIEETPPDEPYTEHSFETIAQF